MFVEQNIYRGYVALLLYMDALYLPSFIPHSVPIVL